MNLISKPIISVLDLNLLRNVPMSTRRHTNMLIAAVSIITWMDKTQMPTDIKVAKNYGTCM